MSETRTISVLGSTGSVGTQVLDVVMRLGKRIKVHSLAAGGNIDLLETQASRFDPKYVCVDERDKADELARRLAMRDIKVLCGTEGMCELAADPAVDTVVVSVQGFAGLHPTLTAAHAGKTIGIASKEVLVCAGPLVNDAVVKGGAKMVPIDSEHSALFQCLVGEDTSSVHKLILTASGGPFRNMPLEEMKMITPLQALSHPTWNMGRKITVDSATLMNKGLEIIEAQALFGIDVDRVQVVVHPKSIVHSLVEFQDGSVKAQLGLPDMRLPIQYALLYPERPDTGLPRLDMLECGALEFFAPDLERFPMLRLAREAGKAGGSLPTVMSAANDIAVESFLGEGIAFLEIAEVVEEVMQLAERGSRISLIDILNADEWARKQAHRVIQKKQSFLSLS